MAKCSQCDRPVEGRGLCHKHYMQWWHTSQGVRVDTSWPNGEPEAKLVRVPRGMYKTCTSEECDRPHASKGLCNYHYKKQRYR